MKYKYFVLISFALFSLRLDAQNLSIPPSVDLLKYVEAPNLVQTTRMWGWSRDGKVAYSTETKNMDEDKNNVSFCVFDFVNDKAVFKIDIDSGKTEDAATAYNKRRDEIKNAMSRYSIVEQQASYLRFPIRKGNESYRAETSYTMKTYRPGEAGYQGLFPNGGSEYREEYSIVIHKNNGKQKTIKTYTMYSGDGIYGDGPGFELDVCGYFLSPFENRVLIVILRFEGYDSIDFSGCHLDFGF